MTGIHLTRYLVEQEQQGLLSTPALRLLLETVADACKRIGHLVNQGELGGALGSNQTENVQGEVQKKLDVIANDIMLEAHRWGGYLSGLASEEMEQVQAIDAGATHGEYLLLFDPLDGSSNIDVNVTVGTIFSVLRIAAGSPASEAAFLQAGTRQVAAGYALYGPQTMLVLSLGHGVVGFTLDRNTGTWTLTQASMHIPEQTREFAINMSNQRHWEEPVQRYVAELLAGKSGSRGTDFNMRWIASMVADVHRILTRGGIFMYPRDAREPGKAGKLRLMYEANPMSFLVEQAGGAATNGHQRILDIEPAQLHERVAVFLGSRHEVERVTGYHAS